MKKIIFSVFACLFTACFLVISCGGNSEIGWPEGNLYDAPENDPFWNAPSNIDEAKEAIEGYYAHYDIVAYEEMKSNGMMRNFIISYGITQFYTEGDKLIEHDRFCHAEYKMNQSGVTAYFRDEATQAIIPDPKEVQLYRGQDGSWKVHRPETPTLLGVIGDSYKVLPTDREDPFFLENYTVIDPDEDGKPGVTVNLKITKGIVIKGELYIARRERFNNFLTLYNDGTQILFGHVEDFSEQLVLGANKSMLDEPSNPAQAENLGLSPMILIKLDDNISCDELMERRDEFFPKEPDFLSVK